MSLPKAEGRVSRSIEHREATLHTLQTGGIGVASATVIGNWRTGC
ncbi:hypothetical protein PV396_43455 [Streptomyces sp. ME02-8801-2C]|nr:hypothetical protein [Streptomyces sp. ME02-8801-2C]MDX3458708.1 hypothetical protein [Streptomyces sp. ME02-8801-2C]